jgi:hypothetical protein
LVSSLERHHAPPAKVLSFVHIDFDQDLLSSKTNIVIFVQVPSCMSSSPLEVSM